MKYKADSRGNIDLDKVTLDVIEAWKKGNTNYTVEVDMTDYINALIQKSIKEKGIKH